ncbi:MAG: ABC transporter ATP-binding protein [Myxococcota bacterium]
MAPPETNTAIEVRGLEKRYGDHRALAGINLSVPAGSCFGLLGPNGAGKSTTVGVLTTLLSPSGGTATLLGHDVERERAAVRARLGVVFQEPALDPELSAREQLRLHARLFRLESPAAVVDDWIERLDLVEHADRAVRKLSGGLRRRVEIARGLLNRPGVLFLDEPTTGLDPAARARIWDELRKLRDSGETTLFLTTHSMEEADALCDEIAILDAGEVRVTGPPERLKADLGGDVVTVVLRDAPASAEAALSSVAGVQRVDASTSDAGTTFHVTVRDAPQQLARLLDPFPAADVLAVEMQRPSLEHVFLHHTGHTFESVESEADAAASDAGAA